MPVVFIERVERWIYQAPICVRTRYRHIHAAQRIYNSAEAVELDHGSMINTDAEIIEDRILKQSWSAARIANRNPMLVGSIDALILPFGDEHPQVTRDGDEGYLSLIRAQDGDNHCIRAEGTAGPSIRTD